MLINKLISCVEHFFNFFKNFNKFSLKQTYKNNLGSFKFKFFSDRSSKYKFFLYFYIFITMSFCPWLDNLFNNWYDLETYNLYYVIFFCFFFNYVLNIILIIPTKNTLDFKLFFLNLKSFYFYINNFFFKFLKIFIFLKNEVIFKSFLFNWFLLNFNSFLNYFTYWRPLFKRFSYFGFNKLTKSKFYKNIK
jgi:hypothetical protein